MLCERCRIREANIQYTEVINGVKTEHNYCAQCAKELDFGPYAAIFDSEMPLGKLLSGLLGLEEGQKKDKFHQIVCPNCGMSYDEFVKNSRFGCPDCYSVFDVLISDNIKQLQGSEAHTGKRPRNQGEPAKESPVSLMAEQKKEQFSGPEEQIKLLRARLDEALKKEEYELAAECRDKIKALKEGQ